MNQNYRFLLSILFFALFFLCGCERDSTVSQSNHSSSGGTILSQQIQMPEFELRSWQGNMVHSRSLDNNVLLVMFFSPTSPGCISFLIEMDKIKNSFTAKKFSLVAIATGKFDPDQLSKLLEKRHLSFPVLLDQTSSLKKKFGENAIMPVTYLVTKERAIIKQYLSHPDLENLKMDIGQIL